MTHSKNDHEVRQEFNAARKQSALAQAWRYDQQYEDGLAAIERNPAVEFTLSGEHRSCLGYYKSARDAAKAAGRDMSKGGSQ